MINITWDPPIDVGDGIKGYIVKWQEVNGTSGSMQKDVPLSIFNAALLAVTPYTWYDIHVQAYNDEESGGPWSKPLSVQSSESGECNTNFFTRYIVTVIVIFFWSRCMILEAVEALFPLISHITSLNRPLINLQLWA